MWVRGQVETGQQLLALKGWVNSQKQKSFFRGAMECEMREGLCVEFWTGPKSITRADRGARNKEGDGEGWQEDQRKARVPLG